MKLRVREYSITGVRGRVVQTVADSITVTDIENGAATLSFAVATAVAGKFTDDVFVVGVEYAVDGKFAPLTRNNLFRVSSNSGDDADTAKTVTFTGTTYPYAMLGKHWVVGGKDGKIDYTRDGAATNAGDIARSELDESRAAGWAPQIGYSFTRDRDSNGVAWVAEDRQQASMSVPATQDKLMKLLVDQGMCEVETRGTELRLLRPGTGRNLTNLLLGGEGVTRLPVKVDAEAQFTRLHVVMDGNQSPVFWVPVPGADERWGTVDALITLSGVTDRATAEKIARERAAEGASVAREESFEWTPNSNGLNPWRDFQVGDTLTARVRGGKRPRRVIGVSAREASGTVEVRVIVGERIGTSNTKMMQKLGSIAVGGIVGGSGQSFTHTPMPVAAPNRPSGVRVLSNTGSWGEGGSAHSQVRIGWAPVTSDTNDQPVTVTEYEVWSRTPDGQLSRDTATAEAEVDIDSWTSGEKRLVCVRAKNVRGEWSNFSTELEVEPKFPTSIVPLPPAALTVVSNVGSFTSAGPVTAIAVAIPKVTKNTDGGDVTVTEYELWDGDTPLMRVPNSPAKFTMPSDGVKKLRARACSDLGVWGDLGAELTVTGAQPAKVTANPMKPTLVTGSGVVASSWGGAWSGAAPGENVLLRVDVEARIGDTGAWVRQGWLDRAGSTTLKLGAPGETVRVRLIPYDRLNRQMGASEIASIVVAGAGLSDLDKAVTDFLTEMDGKAAAAQSAAADAQAEADRARAAADAAARDASAAGGVASGADAKAKQAKDAADAAQRRADDAFDRAVAAATAAGNAQLATNGKNRLWYQSTQPTGTGHTKDDTWFDTSNGMRISQWDGSKWVARQLGTAAIQELAITNALIADAAINNAKIANLDAGKITTGFLAAARLAARSISVEKLLVSDFTNLFDNGRLDLGDGGMAGWATSGSAVRVADNEAPSGFALEISASSGWPSHYQQRSIPVSPGDEFYISGLVKRVAGAGGVGISIRTLFQDVNGKNIANVGTGRQSAATYTLTTGVVKAPQGAVSMRLWIEAGIGDGGATVGRATELSVRRRNTAELIVDGAIRARHIEAEVGLYEKLFASEFMAGRIFVDHLAPNVGENLNLNANGAIVLIAGQQSEIASNLSNTQTALEAVKRDTDANGQTAAAAQAAATIADGKALVAQNQVAQVSTAVAEQQAVFAVIPTGAEVRSKDASSITRIDPTEISMLQGGAKLFRVKDSQVIANELLANRAQIGNHVIEPFGNGTVISSL